MVCLLYFCVCFFFQTDEIYAVKFVIKENKYQWCRGRVTEIIEREPTSENLYGIFYLDYGNTQNVSKTQ